MSENEFTLMNSLKWWLLIPFPSPQGSYERNCVCQLRSAPSGFWRADGIASMPHEENYHTSPIPCANLWSRVCVHKVAPWRWCLGWPWAWLLSPDTWAKYCYGTPMCGCDASPAKNNYSYGHNCAVCQILFHCRAHFTDTFFTSLNCLAASSQLCPSGPSGPAGPNLWGNICCWRAEEHKVQWRHWVHTAAQLKPQHAATNRNRNCWCKCKCFLRNMKTKHECTRFTCLSHPGTSLSLFASINVPPTGDFLIIPASSSARWVGSDVPLSPICATNMLPA